MTNREKIDSLSNRQFAKIFHFLFNCNSCSRQKDGICIERCDLGFLKWLNEEYDEKEGLVGIK